MGSWTNATLPPELPRPRTATDAGVLRPADGGGLPAVYRPSAGPTLARYLERYWSVSWSTARPARREVLTHPVFHLTVTTTWERGQPARARSCTAAVRGVVTSTFATELSGHGRVLGAKFRPGGFAALTGLPAAAFTDRSVPLVELVGAGSAGELTAAVAAAPDDADAGAAALEAFLAPLAPTCPDPAYDVVLAVITDMLSHRDLHRVADVAARHEMSVRTLQRLFQRFVGVGPKWVLQRYRLHDAVAAIDAEPAARSDLAGLAASLGWFDQAHFNRDFRAFVGVSPQAYAARPLVPGR